MRDFVFETRKWQFFASRVTEMSRERRNVLRGAQARRKIMQEKKTFKVLNQHASDQDVLFDLCSLKTLNRHKSFYPLFNKKQVVEKLSFSKKGII